MRHTLAFALVLLPLAIKNPAYCQSSGDTVFFYDFAGPPPAPVTESYGGLFHKTTSCRPTQGGCGEQEYAYYGNDSTCDFQGGYPGGGFALSNLQLPVAESLTLSYCSAYGGEGGCWSWFTDYTLVSVTDELGNGWFIDNPSCGGVYTSSPPWEKRTIDISRFAGQNVSISFFVGHEDNILNDAYGWGIDNITIATGVGDLYCTPSNPNSTGESAGIGAAGSSIIAENEFTLHAHSLPLYEYCYFLMSQSAGYVPGFGGSEGILCLSAPIIRFNNSAGGGKVLDTGETGLVAFTLDLGNLPQGTVFFPGDTWHFQLWFRDYGSGPTSNTTDGVVVTFR